MVSFNGVSYSGWIGRDSDFNLDKWMTVMRSETQLKGYEPIHLGRAYKAFRALMKDNDDTSQVFKIVAALTGKSIVRATERMKGSEFGRKIIVENLNLAEILSNKEWLRSLPEHSFGRIYLEFMEREGLSPEGLAEAEQLAYANDETPNVKLAPDVQAYSNWTRDSHDLWHVITGYGRDPLAELALLGATYSQTKVPGAAFISLLGMFEMRKAYRGAPIFRTVREGFKLIPKSTWLVDQNWEALLPKPIEDVRAELGIGTTPFYQKSLSYFDPLKSNSAQLSKTP